MMKLLILCLIVSIFASQNMASELDKVSASSNVEELWGIYKTEYKRNYEPEEDRERFEIFKANVIRIVAHNAKYDNNEVTYTMGINQFADKKPDEFRSGLMKPTKPDGAN